MMGQKLFYSVTLHGILWLFQGRTTIKQIRQCSSHHGSDCVQPCFVQTGGMEWSRRHRTSNV